MTLQDAMKKMGSDKDLLKRFTENPKSVLKELGVNVSGVKLGEFKAGNPHELSKAAGVSGCVSIGCVVCGSVGS